MSLSSLPALGTLPPIVLPCPAWIGGLCLVLLYLVLSCLSIVSWSIFFSEEKLRKSGSEGEGVWGVEGGATMVRIYSTGEESILNLKRY